MSEEREPLDATPQGSSPGEDFGTARAHRRRSEQHNWRRWAWWALIIATVGFGWALVLATVFIVRSGDRTAALVSLVEEGQQQRQAASEGAQQSGDEREAALESQQQESQTFRAQELAALADQSKGNAEARQALAEAALAESRANTVNSETQTADAQTADALAELSSSIEKLQKAIKRIDKPKPEPGR